MSTQARYAEKLVTLQDVGNELMDRLHRTFANLNQDKLRPSFINDQNYKKIVTELLKKFPELPKDPTVVNKIYLIYSIFFFYWPIYKLKINRFLDIMI